MTAIYKRELKAYFTGMTGFVFIAFLLLFAGIFTVIENLLQGYASFAYTIGDLQTILLLGVPILTMRSIAEERSSKTDQLLCSLPLPMYRIILAKYLAMLTVFLIPVSVMACIPLALSAFGTVPFQTSYSALFGFFLLGAALIAICTFLSSLTESQIIAAVLGLGALFAILMLPTLALMIPPSALVSLLIFLLLEILTSAVVYGLTKSITPALLSGAVLTLPTLILYFIRAEWFSGAVAALLNHLALFDHLNRFVSGILDLTSIVYYLSVIVFFVFLTVQSVEKRRWS